jgi:predicted small secreted protein
MKTVILLVTTSILMVLTACSTVEGAGKDLQDAARIAKKQLGGHVDDK